MYNSGKSPKEGSWICYQATVMLFMCKMYKLRWNILPLEKLKLSCNKYLQFYGMELIVLNFRHLHWQRWWLLIKRSLLTFVFFDYCVCVCVVPCNGEFSLERRWIFHEPEGTFCVLLAFLTQSAALVCSSSCVALQANLNDSHNQMVVHWAGEKSNVIVALARDSAGSSGPKTSSVSRPSTGSCTSTAC